MERGVVVVVTVRLVIRLNSGICAPAECLVSSRVVRNSNGA